MTNLTICDSRTPGTCTATGMDASRGDGFRAPPPSPVLARALETRAFFRCGRLAATLSVEQCRANRGRMTPQQMLALPYDVPEWWVQPLPCWSCSLAPVVEAGSVSFYSAEEVLAGAARAPTWPHSASPAGRGRQGGHGGHRLH